MQARWFEGVGEEQLYDTISDPHETRNLAAEPYLENTKRRLRFALEDFLARAGDTSEQPEQTMRDQFLRDGQVPDTQPPSVSWRDGRASLVSQEGASIGYRLPGHEHWSLYTTPIDAERFEAKAVRYGFRESRVVDAQRP